MMEPMEFRLAEETELPAVYTLYQSVLGREFCVWNSQYPGMDEIRQDHDTGNLFLLTQGDALLGALSIVPENELDALPCWHHRTRCREIARVVVSPAYQGAGLAGYMVQQIIPILQNRGCQSIHLAVVNGNLPARRTYEKTGFLKVGEAPLYGHHYDLMELAVDEKLPFVYFFSR